MVAASKTVVKKTPEELRAVKLNNLEKAREAKALYKKLDNEAKARGEIPPSVARKVERNFPIMLDSNKQVRSLNLNDQLWNTQMNIALPQLLYYAPELWYQYLHLLGGQPVAGKKKSTPSTVEDGEAMDVNAAVMAELSNKINIDISHQGTSRVMLQSAAVGVSFITSYSNTSVMNINSVKYDAKEEIDFKWDINPELTQEQQEKLRITLVKHKSVFVISLKEIKSLNVDPYVIKVKPGIKPVKVTPRMLPVSANEWLKNYLTELIELDVIEPCSGPWEAAVVLVPNDRDNRKPRRRFKKAQRIPKIRTSPTDAAPKSIWSISVEVNAVQDEYQGHEEEGLSTLEEVQYSAGGSTRHMVEIKLNKTAAGNKDPYRLCLNYRPINLAVLDTGYPIPNINALFTLLANATYYSVFDCLKGFWQLELDEESRDYTGFAKTFGQYRWKRLPMGLKVSPQACQSCMDSAFFEELNKFFLIYIDDGLVFSNSFDQHIEHLDRILTKAKVAGLSLSVSKC